MQNLNIPNANFGIVRDLLTDYQVKMLMQELEALKWQQFRNMPRTNAAFGKGYTYSGVTHPTTKMPTFLKDLSILCSNAVEFPINYWDSVLLNKYANGKDSIGFHSDDEPELGYNPRVMAVSLGAERTFTLIDKATKQEHNIVLPHNSLILMGNMSQVMYQHGIRKDPSCNTQRISITYRHHEVQIK